MNDQVKNIIDRLIDAEHSEQTENFDLSLRPKLIEFIGQPSSTEKSLNFYISS